MSKKKFIVILISKVYDIITLQSTLQIFYPYPSKFTTILIYIYIYTNNFKS